MSDAGNTSSQVTREREIIAVFEATLDLEPGDRRDHWLQERCGSDKALRDEVQALIEASERAGGFLSDSETTAEGEYTVTIPSPPIKSAVRPGSTLGPYKILQQLGEGGFGEVFLAEQAEPVQRQVALKIIKPGMDSREIMARFEAERQALAMMDHPNIATVLDAGSAEAGRPYFVMELVRGMAITKFCDKEQLTTTARLSLFEQVCSAIQHAHQKGVIHRDIKPSNVLVTSYDGRPAPKVIDFGIAKAMQQKLTKKTLFTRFEQFIGTPAYMSPEQAEQSGLDLDTRSDVYALGVLLYELLVGSPPFDASEWAKAGFDEIRRRIREDTPKKPSTRLATLPDKERSEVALCRSSDPERLDRVVVGDLDWIVMKALEKDRRRRYESPSALARDLARFRSHESIEARPPSTSYRLRQFFRRHRLPCLAGLFCFLSLIGGLVISLYGLAEATKGRAEAEANLIIAQENETEARQQSARADQEAATVRRLLYPNILEAATESLRNGQRTRAVELLETCPESERGWEWRRAVRQLISPTQHYETPHSRSRVEQLQVSASGEKILATLKDGSLHVWDLARPRPLASFTRDDAPVLQSAFRSDEDQVVSIDEDSNVRLSNPVTGRELSKTKLPAFLESVSLSARGNYLVASDVTGQITLWPGHFNEPIAVMEDRVIALTCLAIDEMTSFSAAGSLSGTTTVWDASGIQLWETSPQGGSILKIQFSSDGTLLATGDEFGRVKIFIAENGRPLSEWSAHQRGVSAIAFDQAGQTIATAGQEGGVSLRDIATGRELGFFVGDEAGISALVFGPTGHNLLTGGETGNIRTYDLHHLPTTVIYEGHRDLIFESTLAPDGTTLVTVSRDATLRYWDTKTGVELRRLTSQADAILSIDISPDGKWLATRGDDAVMRVRHFTTGELVWEQPVDPRVRHVRFHPNSKHLAAGAARTNEEFQDQNPIIAIWDLQRKTEAMRLAGHRGIVLQMAFNPDATRLATTSNHGPASLDGRTIIWNLEKQDLETILHPSSKAVSHAVAWSPAGNRIYTGHGDGSVTFWQVSGTKERVVYAHGEPVGAMTISPDGRTLATGAWYSEEMKLWNAVTGELKASAPTGIPGLSDIQNDRLGDGWIVCGLDGGLIRLHTDQPIDGAFSNQRKASQATRQAILTEEILLSGGTGTDGFAASVEALILDHRRAWRLADREGDFRQGPEELAATSLTAIAEEYLRSDLFDEAYIAMNKSLNLAPTDLRQNQLRWIEEAQALEEGMGQALNPENMNQYIGTFGNKSITNDRKQINYRDESLGEEWTLLPMTAELFQLAGDASKRLRFVEPSEQAKYQAIRMEEFSGRSLTVGLEANP